MGLQEFLLSPRILHFGDQDITWHCQTVILPGEFSTITSFKPNGDGLTGKRRKKGVPDLPKRLPSNIFQGVKITDDDGIKIFLDTWLSIIEDYVGRAFSDEKDRLTALAGLASEIQKSINSGYVSAMWTKGVIKQMGWKSGYRSPLLPNFTNTPTSSAPSWSWMAPRRSSSFDRIEIEDAEVIICTPSETSQKVLLSTIQGCELVLRAKTIQASLYSKLRVRPKIRFSMDYESKKGYLDENTHWLLLGYTSRKGSVGLVIQPVPQGRFVRIGQFLAPKSGKIWQHEEVKAQEIALI